MKQLGKEEAMSWKLEKEIIKIKPGTAGRKVGNQDTQLERRSLKRQTNPVGKETRTMRVAGAMLGL